MFYRTQRTFHDFSIDCSGNEFLPRISTVICGVVFGYDFQTEEFFSEAKTRFFEHKSVFEKKFQDTFLMDIPTYTEHLKKKEELYELNIEQMEELLFYAYY